MASEIKNDPDTGFGNQTNASGNITPYPGESRITYFTDLTLLIRQTLANDHLLKSVVDGESTELDGLKCELLHFSAPRPMKSANPLSNI